MVSVANKAPNEKDRGNLLRAILVPVVIAGIVTTACSNVTATTPGSSTSGVLRIVAAENFWGSIAVQVGGSHVSVVSIIKDPNTDPHSYEPISQDARTIADAHYVIYNGVGYDSWMDKLIAANPVSGRRELNIGSYFGMAEGDNPHMWYNPEYVTAIAGKVRDDLKAIDPADASAFDQSAQQYLDAGLQQYRALIDDIRARYKGTSIGASESIFTYMATALGLDLITPASYLKAVSEGTDISAADEATVERQMGQKQIQIFIYNSQNTPPNIQILLTKAKALGIPTAKITETLVPATETFQDWQSAELQGIENALNQATGK